MTIAIDGKSVGKSPLPTREIEPGAHEIVVEEACWLREGERIIIRKGEKKQLHIEAHARMSAVSVSAHDEQGNDLDAEVRVDGVAVGRVPGITKVPMCSRAIEVVATGGLIWKGELSLKEKVTEIIAATLAMPRAATGASDGNGPRLEAAEFLFGGTETVKEVSDSQIKVLQRLIDKTGDNDPEKPDYVFRMAVLYLEVERYYDFRVHEFAQKISDAQAGGQRPPVGPTRGAAGHF